MTQEEYNFYIHQYGLGNRVKYGGGGGGIDNSYYTRTLGNPNELTQFASSGEATGASTNFGNQGEGMSANTQGAIGMLGGMAGDTLEQAAPGALGTIGGGAMKGAAAGMAFGPWGAAVGGVIGAAGGMLKNRANNEAADALQTKRNQANILDDLKASINANDMNFEQGGDLNGITEYNGLQHNQGGIPIGQNAEVEDGETRSEDYIYSDKLKPKGSKSTYAEISKKIAKKYTGMENDRFAPKAEKQELKELELQQEAQKAENFQKDLAKLQQQNPEAFQQMMQQQVAQQQQQMQQQAQQLPPEQQQQMQQQNPQGLGLGPQDGRGGGQGMQQQQLNPQFALGGRIGNMLGLNQNNYANVQATPVEGFNLNPAIMTMNQEMDNIAQQNMVNPQMNPLINQEYALGGTIPTDGKPKKLRQKEYDTAKAQLDSMYSANQREALKKYRSEQEYGDKYGLTESQFSTFMDDYAQNNPVDYSSIELDTSPYPTNKRVVSSANIATSGSMMGASGFDYGDKSWHSNSAAMSQYKNLVGSGRQKEADELVLGYFDKSKRGSGAFSEATHGKGVGLGTTRAIRAGDLPDILSADAESKVQDLIPLLEGTNQLRYGGRIKKQTGGRLTYQGTEPYSSTLPPEDVPQPDQPLSIEQDKQLGFVGPMPYNPNQTFLNQENILLNQVVQTDPINTNLNTNNVTDNTSSVNKFSTDYYNKLSPRKKMLHNAGTLNDPTSDRFESMKKIWGYNPADQVNEQVNEQVIDPNQNALDRYGNINNTNPNAVSNPKDLNLQYDPTIWDNPNTNYNRNEFRESVRNNPNVVIGDPYDMQAVKGAQGYYTKDKDQAYVDFYKANSKGIPPVGTYESRQKKLTEVLGDPKNKNNRLREGYVTGTTNALVPSLIDFMAFNKGTLPPTTSSKEYGYGDDPKLEYGWEGDAQNVVQDENFPSVDQRNTKAFTGDPLTAGISAIPNLAAGIGSAFLGKNLEYDRARAEQYDPNFVDPTRAIQESRDQYAGAKDQIRQASRGAGNYMSNLIGATASQSKASAGIHSQYDNINAGIANQAGQFNAQQRQRVGLTNAQIGMQEQMDKTGLYQNALGLGAAGLNTGIGNYIQSKQDANMMNIAGGPNFYYERVGPAHNQVPVRVVTAYGYETFNIPGEGTRYRDPITKQVVSSQEAKAIKNKWIKENGKEAAKEEEKKEKLAKENVSRSNTDIISDFKKENKKKKK